MIDKAMILGTVAWAAAELLAQSGPDLSGIPGGIEIGQIASIGFAVWYGFYVTKYAIPKIIDKQTEREEKSDARHEEAIKTITGQLSMAFQSQLKLIIDSHDRDRERFTCAGRPPNNHNP